MLKNITLFMLMFLILPVLISAYQRQADLNSIPPDYSPALPTEPSPLEFQKLGPPPGRFFGNACPITGCGPAPEKVGIQMNAYHMEIAMQENQKALSVEPQSDPHSSDHTTPDEVAESHHINRDTPDQKTRPEQLIDQLDNLINEIGVINSMTNG